MKIDHHGDFMSKIKFYSIILESKLSYLQQVVYYLKQHERNKFQMYNYINLMILMDSPPQILSDIFDDQNYPLN